MTETPLISFIMLAYRQESLVREAVRAALAQDYPRLEIILSDDCSPDATFAAIEEEVAAYRGPHQVIARRPDRNLGLLPHLYDAVRLASGALLVLAAGDDISEPDRVSRLVEAWQASGADGLCSGWTLIDEQGRTIGTGAEAASDIALERIFQGQPHWQIAGATAAYTPQVFRELSDPGRLFAEDFYFTLFLRWRGRSIARVDAPLIRYRVHQGALTNNEAAASVAEEEAKVRRWSGEMAQLLGDFARRVDAGVAPGSPWGAPGPIDRAALDREIAFNTVRAEWDWMTPSARLGAVARLGDRSHRRWMLPRLLGPGPVDLLRRVRGMMRGRGGA